MPIAIVPARAGSKRIPNKNVRIFNGKPIIRWPLKTLQSFSEISRIIVSTDSEEIAAVARDSGAEIFKRGEAASTDMATSIEALREVLLKLLFDNEIEGREEVFLCYPTSVFLREEMLMNALRTLRTTNAHFVTSAQRTNTDVGRLLELDAAGNTRMKELGNFDRRTQDSQVTFEDAAQVYLATANDWCERQLYADTTRSVPLSRHSVIDIDELEDWGAAEALHRFNLDSR